MPAIPKNKHFHLRDMDESHFEKVRVLSNSVFGENYTTLEGLKEDYKRSCAEGKPTSSFIITLDEQLVGFRITYGPKTWDIVEDYTPEKWGVDPEKVCYFKISCIHPDYRGMGLGQVLIDGAIDRSKKQGAVAGVADIWLNSPHNSSYKYFSKAGGEVVNIYQDRYIDIHTPEKPCSRCGAPCHCLGAEMILHFGETRNE